jgi:mono/diheme cytochrome c family protein
MRVTRGVLLALAVPAFVFLTAISTLADSSPSPSSNGSPSASGSSALPGDPTKGQSIYQQNCTVCHGASGEGGVGATLNPIEPLAGVSKEKALTPEFLIDIVTNGRNPQPGDPKQAQMPAWKGKLSEQDIKDVAAFIIQLNKTPGGAPLSPGELAKRTILWVAIGIIAMIFITYLLSAYNMRWIARRAAARRK